MNFERNPSHTRGLKLASLMAGGMLLLKSYGIPESNPKKDVQKHSQREQKDKVIDDTRDALLPMLVTPQLIFEEVGEFEESEGLKESEDSEEVQENASEIFLKDLLATCHDIFVGKATLYAKELRADLSTYVSEAGLNQMDSYLGLGCEVAGVSENLAGQQILRFKAPEVFNCDVEFILKQPPKKQKKAHQFEPDLPKKELWKTSEDEILDACKTIYKDHSVALMKEWGFSEEDMDSLNETVQYCLPENVYEAKVGSGAEWRATFEAPQGYGLCDILYVTLDNPVSYPPASIQNVKKNES